MNVLQCSNNNNNSHDITTTANATLAASSLALRMVGKRTILHIYVCSAEWLLVLTFAAYVVTWMRRKKNAAQYQCTKLPSRTLIHCWFVCVNVCICILDRLILSFFHCLSPIRFSYSRIHTPYYICLCHTYTLKHTSHECVVCMFVCVWDDEATIEVLKRAHKN